MNLDLYGCDLGSKVGDAGTEFDSSGIIYEMHICV